MNCQASIPGPRGDRDPWPDNGKVRPPDRPPQLRTVLFWVGIYLFAVGVVAIVGAFALQWWRSS